MTKMNQINEKDLNNVNGGFSPAILIPLIPTIVDTVTGWFSKDDKKNNNTQQTTTTTPATPASPTFNNCGNSGTSTNNSKDSRGSNNNVGNFCGNQNTSF